MLSKPATMLLGFIYEKPLNAYEIIKLLNYMNVKWWFNIADSTVYSTLKTLEKKEFISGTTEKVGNMPDRTVYKLLCDVFLARRHEAWNRAVPCHQRHNLVVSRPRPAVGIVRAKVQAVNGRACLAVRACGVAASRNKLPYKGLGGKPFLIVASR